MISFDDVCEYYAEVAPLFVNDPELAFKLAMFIVERDYDILVDFVNEFNLLRLDEVVCTAALMPAIEIGDFDPYGGDGLIHDLWEFLICNPEMACRFHTLYSKGRVK